MLRYTVIFFALALVAALFGFSSLSASAAIAAKIVFAIFIALALGSVLMALARR